MTLDSTEECPMGPAWADKAYEIDSAHRDLECSNAGICDRSSGLCKCFDGFAGSACQRSEFSDDFNSKKQFTI